MKIEFIGFYAGGETLKIDTEQLDQDLMRAGYEYDMRTYIISAVMDQANRQGDAIKE